MLLFVYLFPNSQVFTIVKLITKLQNLFRLQFSSVAIFIMEKLQGADILTYLTSRQTYNEQIITTVITQVTLYVFIHKMTILFKICSSCTNNLLTIFLNFCIVSEVLLKSSLKFILNINFKAH